MRVLIDSNVLFSAVYRLGSIPHQALLKAIKPPYQCLVCEQSFNELYNNFSVKFPDRLDELNIFYDTLKSLVEVIPMQKSNQITIQDIRDPDDLPILHAAVAANADFIISGDLDFLESNITKPVIIKAAEFVKLDDQ